MNKHRPRKKGHKGRRLDAQARAARREARARKRANAAMVSPEDVGKVLGRGKNQIYEDIASGNIPAMRFGRRWFIARAWLDRACSGEAPAAS
jgi:excisionase family DNA binding protein